MVYLGGQLHARLVRKKTWKVRWHNQTGSNSATREDCKIYSSIQFNKTTWTHCKCNENIKRYHWYTFSIINYLFIILFLTDVWLHIMSELFWVTFFFLPTIMNSLTLVRLSFWSCDLLTRFLYPKVNFSYVCTHDCSVHVQFHDEMHLQMLFA